VRYDEKMNESKEDYYTRLTLLSNGKRTEKGLNRNEDGTRKIEREDRTVKGRTKEGWMPSLLFLSSLICAYSRGIREMVRNRF